MLHMNVKLHDHYKTKSSLPMMIMDKQCINLILPSGSKKSAEDYKIFLKVGEEIRLLTGVEITVDQQRS